MISSHKIQVLNDSEVLYLYFDFSYEFSKLDSIKEEDILSKILSYIKRKKLKFAGQTILLCASGIVFGTLFFNPNTNRIDFDYKDSVIVTKNILNDSASLTNQNMESNKDVEFEVEDKITSEEDIIQESLNKIEWNTSTQTTNTSASTQNIQNQENLKEEGNHDLGELETKQDAANDIQEEVEEPTVLEENEKIEEVSFQTPVTIYLRNGNVITLELEDYLVGVLAAEMPASFHVEALKAGAIAARTYTLKCITDGRILTDTEATQSYDDIDELKIKWGSDFDIYYNKIVNAVHSTNGIYMTYNGKYIDAVYHSSNNGYTVAAVAVWGNDIPYLKSVDSPYDIGTSSYLHTVTMPLEKFNERLNINYNTESTFEIIKDNTNHVKKLIIDGNTFTGIAIRTKLGLRSTDFDIALEENTVKITTRGYGHGVGMSQYGANTMANAGYNYAQILSHYYSGVTIGR